MNFQIQPLKSQIINMTFQLDNIELQMMNNYLFPITNHKNTMNNSLIGEQLFELSI